ncbi:hypothetical protein C8R44DRAFT_848598 [Mycena epipterygia]|nr:hypothetical protein C8R44DRAFT_848598 [Mycena epipterygia]
MLFSLSLTALSLVSAASAAFSSGGMTILAPGGDNLWWLDAALRRPAQQPRLDLRGEHLPQFTVWINNSDTSLLTAITPLINVEQNFNCNQGITPNLYNAPLGDGYTIVLSNINNVTDSSSPRRTIILVALPSPSTVRIYRLPSPATSSLPCLPSVFASLPPLQPFPPAFLSFIPFSSSLSISRHLLLLLGVGQSGLRGARRPRSGELASPAEAERGWVVVDPRAAGGRAVPRSYAALVMSGELASARGEERAIWARLGLAGPECGGAADLRLFGLAAGKFPSARVGGDRARAGVVTLALHRAVPRGQPGGEAEPVGARLMEARAAWVAWSHGLVSGVTPAGSRRRSYASAHRSAAGVRRVGLAACKRGRKTLYSSELGVDGVAPSSLSGGRGRWGWSVVYAVSDPFSIKALSVGYPPASATPVDQASATVSKGTASNQISSTGTGTGSASTAGATTKSNGAVATGRSGALVGALFAVAGAACLL